MGIKLNILNQLLFLVILSANENSEVDYNRDIRPIISQKCFKCHGLDDSHRKGKLRLDDRSHALKGGKSGSPAIISGKPESSELYLRIISSNESEQMPPPASKISLTTEEKTKIKKWIESGANYETHWAFRSLAKPIIPKIIDNTWPANEIDSFVLSKLETNNRKPSPAADKYSLVRRVYLDLLGYPPTLLEVDAFINDKRADAYGKLVDGLLQSEHYGERWARKWMDLARYADTNGYEKDRYRSIWPWRDWLIKAINSDMPFNDFTIKQLAGDLLSNPSSDDIIATGFHRNTMLNEEGGIDPLEYRYLAMVDRVATTGVTWLGLTYGCAQCHTHKYDPITQKDYFGLMAFMNNTSEIDYDIPSVSITEKRNLIKTQSAKLKSQLLDVFLKTYKVEDSKNKSAFVDQKIESWIEKKRKLTNNWTIINPIRMKSNLPKLSLQNDGIILVSGDITKQDFYEISFKTDLKNISAIRLEALPDENLPGGGPGLAYYEGPKGDFFLSNFELEDQQGKKKFSDARESYFKNNFGGNPSSAKQAIDDDLQTGWSCAGRYGERHEAIFIIDSKTELSSEFKIKMTFGRHYACSLGKFRISISQDHYGLPSNFDEDIQKLLFKPVSKMNSSEKERMIDAFLFDSPELKADVDKIKQLNQSIPALEKTLVFKEREPSNKRITYLHNRGEYLQPTEEILADTPSFLPKIPQGVTKDRLAFAKWVASEQNPLTARVFVNRNWHTFFGRGFVKTTEDFGIQGDFPSHPELLDWLSNYFVDNNWSMKKLHRLIVTSSTYKQSSLILDGIDKDNALLARGPRVRLEAEMIRDSVLRSCGLLSTKIGGPSVYPPQPKGVTSEGTYGGLNWKSSNGEDRFRRAIYTFSKRTAPYAMFSTFDAPSGESCLARREASNTPLQALTLLNDIVIMEAAQGFAKTITTNQKTLDENLHLVFRSILTRPASNEELTLLRYFYTTTLIQLKQNPEGLVKITGSVQDKSIEQTAWILMVRSLLNLDEALVKR